MSSTVLIDHRRLEEAVLIYRAINNPVRQAILKFLHKAGKIYVMAVYKKMKAAQATTSFHLSILRRAKLVFAERESKRVFYSVNYKKIQQLHSIADKLLTKNKYSI